MALSNLRRLSGLILRCDQAVRNDSPKPKGKTSTSTHTRYLRSLSTPIFIPEKLCGKISLGSCIQPRRQRTLIICDFYSTSESSHAPLPRQWYQPRISSSSPVLIYFVNAISSSNHPHQIFAKPMLTFLPPRVLGMTGISQEVATRQGYLQSFMKGLSQKNSTHREIDGHLQSSMKWLFQKISTHRENSGHL